MSEGPSNKVESGTREFLKTAVFPIEDPLCASGEMPGMKNAGKLAGLALLDVNPVDATATVIYDERVVSLEEIQRFLKECSDHCRAFRGARPVPRRF